MIIDGIYMCVCVLHMSSELISAVQELEINLYLILLKCNFLLMLHSLNAV